MKPKSKAFLKKMKESQKVRGQHVDLSAVLRGIGEAQKEIVDLLQAHDDADLEEDDQQVRGRLPEYDQKLRGLERELGRLREQARKVDRIFREVAEFDAREGDKLRGTDTIA